MPEGAERPHVLAEGLLLLLGLQHKWQHFRGGEVLPQDTQPAPMHSLQAARGMPGLRVGTVGACQRRAPAGVMAGQDSQQGL